MNYNKFHKFIEEQNTEEKEELYERLKQRLNLPEAPAKENKNTGFIQFFKKPYRIIACASAALVVLCLAIFIPLALKGGELAEERYCYEKDCVKTDIASIKDYAEENDLPLLYLEWYEKGQLIYSNLFSDNTEKFVYIKEKISNDETGDLVILYITDKNTKVDVFEKFWNICDIEYTFNSNLIYWKAQSSESLAYFENGNYRYFIELVRPMSEEAILDIVREMLPE